MLGHHQCNHIKFIFDVGFAFRFFHLTKPFLSFITGVSQLNELYGQIMDTLQVCPPSQSLGSNSKSSSRAPSPCRSDQSK